MTNLEKQIAVDEDLRNLLAKHNITVITCMKPYGLLKYLVEHGTLEDVAILTDNSYFFSSMQDHNAWQ